MALTRITITIPADLVRAADKAARGQDRSRSWVVADALRRELGATTRRVREETAAPYTATPHAEAFAAARTRHLAADLKLTPSERARRADSMGDLAESRELRPTRDQVISFASYDEFYAWKTSRRIVG